MDKFINDLHYLFIINPVAGRKYIKNLANLIKNAFENNGLSQQFSIVMTDRRGHASELAKTFGEEYGASGIVIACGGDGTANEVAQALYGSETIMSILPIGTANDFARAAFPTLVPEIIIEKLLQPQIKAIDVFLVDQSVCLNIMSLGFDTKVQKTASRLNSKYRWLGGFSYPLAVFLSLWGRRDYNMSYRLKILNNKNETEDITGSINYILAAACNGKYYGGGFNPAPNASLTDGILDLCLVEKMPLYRMISLIGKYKKGKHTDSAKIQMYRVVSGEIAADKGENFLGNIDGEQFSKEKLFFEVLPQCLRFAFIDNIE